jgi:hypothetical protein
MAVGYFWRKGTYDFRWKLEVEFSSQPGFKYAFKARLRRRRQSGTGIGLRLDRAQGTRKRVWNRPPGPAKSLPGAVPELLYTALTRQTERVIILHQGSRAELRKFSSDDRSETARRLTNLFEVPQPVEIDGRFYEEKLIHRTSRGQMVRSKS